MTQHNNRQYWGLGGNIAILFILIFLYFFQILDNVNNQITDIVSRYSPVTIPAEQRSLVIECSRDQSFSGSELWIDLIKNLEQNGARQIIFLFLPSQAKDDLFKLVSGEKKIFFANSDFTPTNREATPPFPFPAIYDLQTGPVSLPPSQNGVYRTQYLFLDRTTNRQSPHLISMAAEGLQRTSSSGTPTFMVNFNGRKIGSQPRIDLELALRGTLLETLISGKTVFIGRKSTLPFSGLQTPVAKDNNLMSPDIYTAYSYDTLINDQSISRCGPFAAILLFILFILGGTVSTHYMRVGLAILSTFSAFILSGLLAWLSFSFALIQIPLAELLLGQFLLILLIVTGKSMLSEEKTRAVAFETKQKVQERLMPANIYNSKQYWLQVVGMVSQLLNLDRSIFLERVPGDNRVREVAAANTSLDAISERRRDYQRFPYTEALAENGAIEVRDYLSAGTEEEHQYLTPLKITDGGVLGFWACSISTRQKKLLPELTPMLNTFASQISELLYAREQWQNELKSIQNPMRKLLALEGGGESFDEINNAFALLSKRLSTVETVFDSLGTGAILYDLFGQVVYANQKIVALCREIEASPYKYSGAELVALLSGQEISEVRQLLSDLIFSGEAITFYTPELGKKSHTYLLTVRSISDNPDTQKNFADEPINAFNVMGILLEIHEVSDMKKVQKQKEAYFNYSSQAFRGYELSFSPVLEKLKNEVLSQDVQTKLVNFLDTRLNSLFEFIERLRQVMNQDILEMDAQYFPTDCTECLRAAIEKVSPEATSKKLDFDLQFPDYMAPALAVPEELEIAFKNMIIYLIQDAEPNSTVSVTVHRDNKHIICTLENHGYGMPDHDFQNYLTDDETMLSQEFRSLFAAGNQIREYGGLFEARSELGKGTEIIARLKRFQ